MRLGIFIKSSLFHFWSFQLADEQGQDRHSQLGINQVT
jgi:hypothetical protein